MSVITFRTTSNIIFLVTIHSIILFFSSDAHGKAETDACWHLLFSIPTYKAAVAKPASGEIVYTRKGKHDSRWFDVGGGEGIKLPKEITKVSEIPISQFVLKTKSLEIVNPHGSKFDQFYKLPWTHLDTLKDKIRKRFPSKKVSKVFYPFGGNDGATAFRIFPDADTVLVVENNPVTGSLFGENEPLSFSHEPYVAWESYRDLRIYALMPNLLGKLAAAVPKFRLRAVHRLQSNEWQWFGPDSKDIARSPSEHAVITFDSGPGTPQKRYIHIDAYMRSKDTIQDIWWMKDFTDPDAVILKGSMGLVNPIAKASLPGPRKDILKMIRRSNALVVEGYMEAEPNSPSDGWELSGRLEKEKNEFDDAIILDPFYWGYARKVRISQYR